MAHYEVTYSCGHKGTVQLFGKNSEREQKIAWLEANAVCPECLEAERKAENDKAAEFAREQGWQTLTGSEKQVAWANTIRAEKMANFAKLEFKIAERKAKVSEWLLDHTASSWWIERRDYTAAEIVKSNIKEIFKYLNA